LTWLSVQIRRFVLAPEQAMLRWRWKSSRISTLGRFAHYFAARERESLTLSRHWVGIRRTVALYRELDFRFIRGAPSPLGHADQRTGLIGGAHRRIVAMACRQGMPRFFSSHSASSGRPVVLRAYCGSRSLDVHPPVSNTWRSVSSKARLYIPSMTMCSRMSAGTGADLKEDTGSSSWSAFGSRHTGHQTCPSAVSPPRTRATPRLAQLRKAQPGRQASC
jgi:hypothetical protein